MTRWALQAILLPVVVSGGYLLATWAGGLVEDVWDGFLGPFMITYWIGFGFTMTWEMAAASLHADRAGPTTTAVISLLVALMILGGLGGPAALIDDPWLLGATIAPGFRLVMPWIEGRLAHRAPTQTTDLSPTNQESSEG